MCERPHPFRSTTQAPGAPADVWPGLLRGSHHERMRKSVAWTRPQDWAPPPRFERLRRWLGVRPAQAPPAIRGRDRAPEVGCCARHARFEQAAKRPRSWSSTCLRPPAGHAPRRDQELVAPGQAVAAPGQDCGRCTADCRRPPRCRGSDHLATGAVLMTIGLLLARPNSTLVPSQWPQAASARRHLRSPASSS